MAHSRLQRFLEFLVIGVLLGITEDVIAVTLTTDASVTPEMLGVIVLVAIPFAALSELVVDHPRIEVFDRLAAWLHARVSSMA